MNVVFMGTPDFAVDTLKAIEQAGHHISLVITQPDKQKGRGKKVLYTPVKEAALEAGMEVMQPEKVKDPVVLERLTELAPDVIVVVAYGQILPESILKLPKYGCINVHASLLPKYRGAAPIQWAVINGEKVSGVTTMYMAKGLDTGDMIERVEVELSPEETGGSLHDKLARAGAELLVSTLDKLEKGTARRIPQNDAESCYASMLEKSLGNICWEDPAEKIERLIRGLSPWPSAYTYLNGKTLKLWNVTIVKEAALPEGALKEQPAGTILYVDKKCFLIQTGQDCLRVNEMQLEGKKRMLTDAFLRGYHLEAGTKLENERA